MRVDLTTRKRVWVVGAGEKEKSAWAHSGDSTMNWTGLDGHLDGQYLRFWPKWVINITKLGIQIHTFWHNPRPPRLKNGLVKKPCLNWKTHVCTHCSTATLKRKIFEAGKLAKAHTWVSLFLCNFTAKWNICAHCCIPTLQRKIFVTSPYQVMKLCAWLPFQHSKDEFCQFLNGFQLISQ